jgi:hypothetical protein
MDVPMDVPVLGAAQLEGACKFSMRSVAGVTTGAFVLAVGLVILTLFLIVSDNKEEAMTSLQLLIIVVTAALLFIALDSMNGKYGGFFKADAATWLMMALAAVLAVVVWSAQDAMDHWISLLMAATAVAIIGAIRFGKARIHPVFVSENVRLPGYLGQSGKDYRKFMALIDSQIDAVLFNRHEILSNKRMAPDVEAELQTDYDLSKFAFRNAMGKFDRTRDAEENVAVYLRAAIELMARLQNADGSNADPVLQANANLPVPYLASHAARKLQGLLSVRS